MLLSERKRRTDIILKILNYEQLTQKQLKEKTNFSAKNISNILQELVIRKKVSYKKTKSGRVYFIIEKKIY